MDQKLQWICFFIIFNTIIYLYYFSILPCASNPKSKPFDLETSEEWILLNGKWKWGLNNKFSSNHNQGNQGFYGEVNFFWAIIKFISLVFFCLARSKLYIISKSLKLKEKVLIIMINGSLGGSLIFFVITN